jgi:hypothetical protein
MVNTSRASEQYYIDALSAALKSLGWENATGPLAAGVDVVWSEDPAKKPRLLALPPGARTNRFFAMVRVCRKVNLAILLDACSRLHPAEFAQLAPRTWWVGTGPTWAEQLEAHRAYCKEQKQQREGGGGGGGTLSYPRPAYIVKPDNGCQGAGIELVTSHEALRLLLERPEAPERAVVQCYLPTPLLIDGLKFDLRLYVILTCASPLQAFLATNGVARFASHPWRPVDDENASDMLMHLSNSSINQVASGVSNKWALPRVWDRLAANGADVCAVQADIKSLVARTLAAIQPVVAHSYSTAFNLGAEPSRRPLRPRMAPSSTADGEDGGGEGGEGGG